MSGPTDGMTPLEKLRYHVTGAIERGEAEAVIDDFKPGPLPGFAPSTATFLPPDGHTHRQTHAQYRRDWIADWRFNTGATARQASLAFEQMLNQSWAGCICPECGNEPPA